MESPLNLIFQIVRQSEIEVDNMERKEREGLRARLLELCPEIEQLGLYPIVTHKGNRF